MSESFWDSALDIGGQALGFVLDPFGTIADAATDGLANIALENNDQTLGQSKYDFTYKAFPNDLGMDYAGHYMVININVPVWPGTNFARSAYSDQFEVLPGEYSKVDVLRFGSANGGTTAGVDREFYSFPRRTRRIKESIALYMPGTQLIYTGLNTYEEISLTALAGQVGTGILNSAGAAAYIVGGLAGSSTIMNMANGLGNMVGNILSTTGQVIGTGAKLAGYPISPRVEVVFATTLLRDFQFEFLMMPRNVEEAKTIEAIVRTLRFHAAPEVSNVGPVPTFIPPAEFDITFFHRGAENTKIPRINTCVLTRCEVDYAPGTGVFSTFRDGYPVATRLMLVFKEVEIVHKQRVLQGF